MQDIVAEAYVAASGEYSTRTAQVWAEGYTFPPELLQRDLQQYREAGSLYNFCVNRHRVLAPGRLSLIRIFETFGEDGSRIPGLRQSDF
jgi:hypothetical protein